MSMRRTLKPLDESDHLVAREIYSDAIESQGKAFYSIEQIRAWEALAWIPGVLDRPLQAGMGWLSFEAGHPVAFATRYPMDRLALIYCRGHASRSGHATALLEKIELDAYSEGQECLTTEASQLSYSLLLRRGWKLLRPQFIQIGGINFQRFIMKKKLVN